MLFNNIFRLGPFIVDERGRLAPSEVDGFPSFRLCWRHRWVRVSLASGPPPGDAAGTLKIDMDLGRVPSTEGARLPERFAKREHVFSLLQALRTTIPSKWRVTLLADHRVTLQCSEELAFPTTAVELVTDLTMLLFTLDPYIDLIDEVGLGGAAAAAAASLSAFGTGQQALAMS